MNNKIETGKIFIKDILQWWFRVPDYQRPYVWGTDQVNNLLDDVREWGLSKPDSEYFLGSVVLQSRDDNGIMEYDLLDGQQRLTTCLLIHAVGREMTTNSQLRSACTSTVFQQQDPFNGVPERLRIIYDIRDDVRKFVDEFIKPDGGTDDIAGLETARTIADRSVRNLASAVLEIRRYFTETDGFDLEGFFTFFRNKVLMVFVSSGDLDDAFRMFTVLNDRGMKLRGSDILKTLNLRALKESGANETKQQDRARFWEELEGELNDDFDVFLSHVRAVLVKEKARLNLLQEFQDNIYHPKVFDKQLRTYTEQPPLLHMGEETFACIEGYYRHYQQLFSGNNYDKHKSWEFDNLITLLNDAGLANFWVPPLLRYRQVYGDQEILCFLRKLENKFCGDWVTFQTPTDRIRGMNQITAEIDQVRQLAQPPREQINALLASDVFAYDREWFFRILQEEGIYQRRFARYLLFKLDVLYSSADNRLQAPQWMSVEHVLPQNPEAASQWCKDFSEEAREMWTHRLGNLILLGRRKNSTQGRRDFQVKKEQYFTNNIELFPNSVRAMQTTAWTMETLKVNHEVVLQKLRVHA